jgi:hypothetical protein
MATDKQRRKLNALAKRSQFFRVLQLLYEISRRAHGNE